MKLSSSLLSPVLAVLLAATSHAAVIERDWQTPGDGLLTYDTVNKREWLDLNQTIIANYPGTPEQRYLAIEAQTLPGGPFAGFSVGSLDGVFALIESAGVDLNSTDLAVNNDPVISLANLLGPTYGTSKTRIARGFVRDIAPPPNDPDESRFYVSLVRNPLGAWAIASSGDVANTPEPPGLLFEMGVWLYRDVPEPHAWMLVVAAAGLIQASSGRRTRNAAIFATEARQ